MLRDLLPLEHLLSARDHSWKSDIPTSPAPLPAAPAFAALLEREGVRAELAALANQRELLTNATDKSAIEQRIC